MESLFQTVDPASIPFALQVIGSLMGVAIVLGVAFDVVLLILMRRHPLARPAYAERMRRRPWSWREAGFLIMVLILGFLCSQVLAEILLALGMESGAQHIMQLQTLLFQVLAVGVIIYLVRRRGGSWRGAFGLGDGHVLLRIGQGVLFYLAAMPVVLFYGLVSMLILTSLGLPLDRQPAVEFMLDPTQPLLMQLYLAVLAIIGAPVIEEALFRGVALPALLRHTTPARAMLFASLIFAAIHLTPSAVIPLFVFAMALSLAYLYTGNILVPIVMHLLFNTVSLAMLVVARTWVPDLVP
ncbi:MAG: CPBP family intramembrane metalloprotease [Lentisphaerae bacterium]|nr:CPBP family intramembrane metalloprotease [Lentisphaerota bacterium]